MNYKNSTYKKIYHLKAGQYIRDLKKFKFPYGIIEKGETGIGATQAEIKAKRNSIIVFPSRSIAYNKSLSNIKKSPLYIGSLPDKKTISRNQIREYYDNVKIQYKKYLVVADSLHKIFDALGEKVVYQNFFLMFDEIDKFQSESTFRTELENCLDYFIHPDCKGCLVSATLGEFSKNKLDQLPRYLITRGSTPKHNINLFKIGSIHNIIRYLFIKLRDYPTDKILIAHKSINTISKIVDELDKKSRNETKILCGEGSSYLVKEYFGRLENDLLPARINFITAAYFYGVDINEKFHVIMISDRSTDFSLLSISEIRQIVGRCRFPHKPISIDLIIPKVKYDIELEKKTILLNKAHDLLQQTEKHGATLNRMNLDENAISKNRTYQKLLTYNNVQLLRIDRHLQFRISNFTIDQYCNRNKELRELYGVRRSPIKSLSEFYNVTTPPNPDFKGLDIKEICKKSYYEVLQAYGPDDPKSSSINENERRLQTRFKLCQYLYDQTDYQWIIDKKYKNKITFRKEYIKKFMHIYPNYSDVWKYMENSFKLNTFYSWNESKTIISEVLDQLQSVIDLSAGDYKPILNGFFIIKETTQGKKNGFTILKMADSHIRYEIAKENNIVEFVGT